MGLSSGNGRVFRNPSGRTARIAPEIKSGDGSRVSVPVPVIAPIPPPVEAARDKMEQDFSWANVTGSLRRERSIEGLLFGAAIGDAIGLGRSGLSRRTSLKLFGRGPLHYSVLPGVGIPGHDTQRMLLTLQSILRSRSQLDGFRRGFANRLRLHLMTLPFYAGRTNLIASLRLCLGASYEQSGVVSSDNSPLISGLAIACVLQGTGHSVEKWTALCTETTHVSAESVESSVLVARSAYLAVMTPPDEFDPVKLVDRLIKITEDQGIVEQLKVLREGILGGACVHDMAKIMGWGKVVPSSANPTALMAIYAWLTNHDSYEKTIEKAVLLGGDTATLGAVAGGLAGIHLGAKSIPDRWKRWFFGWPNSHGWLEAMAKRFVDWPHGAEDLHAAPAMPARPVLQCLRSMTVNASLVASNFIRLPWRFVDRILGG
jgi:ADP-ribosylglycohydrolase